MSYQIENRARIRGRQPSGKMQVFPQNLLTNKQLFGRFLHFLFGISGDRSHLAAVKTPDTHGSAHGPLLF
ncbi:hypothetical protein Hsw_4149 [Hymenobacter swuensis DY53]|uniref:Uncharacterized protein n=1 Tax=Hymenobacter swuensis DY53 TaxID=1227739 RepID=W8F2W7_9BACT|nr:hypothetical protein Hsw_4149 [Hymenobacter swuensis DY53]